MQALSTIELAPNGNADGDMPEFIRSMVIETYLNIKHFCVAISKENENLFYPIEVLTPAHLFGTGVNLVNSGQFKLDPEKISKTLNHDSRLVVPPVQYANFACFELSKSLKYLLNGDLKNSLRRLQNSKSYFGEFRGYQKTLLPPTSGPFNDPTESISAAVVAQTYLENLLAYNKANRRRGEIAALKKASVIDCTHRIGWGLHSLTRMAKEVRQTLLLERTSVKISVYAEDKIYSILVEANYPKQHT